MSSYENFNTIDPFFLYESYTFTFCVITNWSLIVKHNLTKKKQIRFDFFYEILRRFNSINVIKSNEIRPISIIKREEKKSNNKIMTYLDLGSMKLASLVQQQDQLGLFFPETTAQNIENIKMICSQCNKSISSQFEIFFELDEHFYHRDCYKCKKCSQPFSYIHSTERQTCLPIADHSGILYCDLHFIK